MSAEDDDLQDAVKIDDTPPPGGAVSLPPDSPRAMESRSPAREQQQERKRPRIDQDAGPQRKRGKSMFGLLLGTLNKAKEEEKGRRQGDAARNRAQIEERLQTKLKRETEEVRKQEEAKHLKTGATRKEEELGVKDSIYKLRRTRLPLLANFLITSDVFSDDDAAGKVEAQRSHPPPLYFLPAILTPEQEQFLEKRKAHVKAAAESEWNAFHEERAKGIEEIMTQRSKTTADRMEVDDGDKMKDADKEEMQVDKEVKFTAATEEEPEEKEDVKMQDEDGDDAVEY